jgi:hypothetical protein
VRLRPRAFRHFGLRKEGSFLCSSNFYQPAEHGNPSYRDRYYPRKLSKISNALALRIHFSHFFRHSRHPYKYAHFYCYSYSGWALDL